MERRALGRIVANSDTWQLAINEAITSPVDWLHGNLPKTQIDLIGQ